MPELQKFIKFDAKEKQVSCQGEWILANLTALQYELKKTPWPKADKVIVNGSGITKMDSAGAWLILRWAADLERQGANVQLLRFSEQMQNLLDFVRKTMENLPPTP